MSVSSRAAFAMIIQIIDFGFLKHVIGLFSMKCDLGFPWLEEL